MFTSFAVGAFLLVTGAIGYDVRYLRGLFQGGKWVERPVWWQIALGVALVMLGMRWSRRLAGPRWTSVQMRRRAMINVGSGKSVGAEGKERPQQLPGGPAI